MQTPNNRWDVERAAAWLRRHAWGERGEAGVPAPAQALAVAAAQAAQVQLAPLAQEQDQLVDHGEDQYEEIDIAGWPALVAPFYE